MKYLIGGGYGLALGFGIAAILVHGLTKRWKANCDSLIESCKRWEIISNQWRDRAQSNDIQLARLVQHMRDQGLIEEEKPTIFN